MHARKLLAGLATSAVALTALTLSADPASAVYRPDVDDTTFTPAAVDLIGVGSDTSQHALKLLADGYNATVATGGARLATYAATEGNGMAQAADATIPLPTAEIKRPNGSGAGKGLLFGGATGAGNPDVDYARSSAAVSTAEASAGLQAFPFALDTLGTVTSGSTPTHAPPSIAVADLVKIYNGTYTTWNQLPGGTSTAAIKPLIPQAGSGTRNFFTAQLQAANGGVAVTLASTVKEFQENDDTLIKNDPDAIAPFSKGRARLLGATLVIEMGFSADRALYNVVRGTEVGLAPIQAVFASSGYVCSTAARTRIEQAGFQQLATPANGGVCGTTTQSATSNFTLNQRVVTTTTLTASATKANSYTLTAAVTGATPPSGTVSFYQGDTLLQSGVPLTSGQATYTKDGVAPGSYTFTAQFVPDPSSQFDPSQSGSAGATVKTGSTVVETVPASVVAGNAAKGAVGVALTNTDSKATGTVTIREGAKTLKSVVLSSSGVAALTLPVLAPGTHTLVAVYPGDEVAVASTKTFTVAVTKAKATLSETFPANVAPGKFAKGVVKVTLAGTPLKAGGSVQIRDGAKLLKTVTLTNGQRSVTLPKLTPGKHFLKLVYAGSSTSGAATSSLTIIQKKKRK